jgi:hypothetical protein
MVGGCPLDGGGPGGPGGMRTMSVPEPAALMIDAPSAGVSGRVKGPEACAGQPQSPATAATATTREEMQLTACRRM